MIGSGNLSEAIRASMSIPGVYAPVTLNGRLLVDGGVANNLPVSVAHELGADIVIGRGTSPIPCWSGRTYARRSLWLVS